MTILMEHVWPGIVRELEIVLEHAMVCSRGSLIDPDALPRSLLTLQSPLGPESARIKRPAGSSAPTPASEKQRILRVLESSRWSRGLAAAHLGIDRTTLWRKMRRLGISSPKR